MKTQKQVIKMKRIFGSTINLTATFLFFLSSIYALAATPERWVRIITLRVERDGTQGVYYVDKNSIESRGSFRYYWLALAYSKPLNVTDQGKKFSITKLVAYTAVDCSNKNNYQIYRINVYGSNDTKITSLDFKEGELYFPAQGTAKTRDYVCLRK